jgi:predicted Rossmann fold flavoprotein
LRSKAWAQEIETRGGFLFTHRGYSGPSVLDISHVTTRVRSAEALAKADRTTLAKADRTIRVQWAPIKEDDLLSGAGDAVAAILARHVPARLAEQLMIECGVPVDRRTSSLKRSERVALVEALTAYPLPWSGNEGYKKAEVTGGGIPLGDIDSKTLESRMVEGLYLCGEMLDAFGPIGGHNFSWAWSTGRVAGLAAGARA